MNKKILCINLLLYLFSAAVSAKPPPAADVAWKNIKLTDQLTLSFDGSLRGRYEWTNTRNLGLNGAGRSDAYLGRFLFGSQINYGDYFAGYLQLASAPASTREYGRKPTDIDKKYIAQGYLDITVPTGALFGDDSKNRLRVGRQEMKFGSSRLFAYRDGPNLRRSYDAIRSTWSDATYSADLFFAQLYENKENSWHDPTNHDQKVWGLYSTLPLTALSSKIDVYALGYENKKAAYTQGTDHDRRYTLGSRLFGQANSFDWDSEAAYQTGHFGKKEIRAWAVFFDGGYSLKDITWQPRLGGKMNALSGDKNTKDHQLNTFNSLYALLPYYSDSGLIAPRNLMNVQPVVKLHPTDDITLEASWSHFWRESKSDGFYLGPERPIKNTTSGGRYIGNQTELKAAWQAASWLEIKMTFAYFQVSDTLKSQGMTDNKYVMTSTTVTF
jgi:hypothetical protein